MMNQIVHAIQEYHDQTSSSLSLPRSGRRTTQAIATAVREVLAVEQVAAVAVFTLTGATAALLAKARLRCPILAISPDLSAVRRLCLYYGVDAFGARWYVVTPAGGADSGGATATTAANGSGYGSSGYGG